GLVAARMARAIPRLRRGPRRWARRPLPVPPPAHVRALRVDGPGTIHGAGLVAAVVMVRGALGARALERTAFAARWSRRRAVRTLGARARGAVTLEARPLAGFDRWPLAAHETLTGRTGALAARALRALARGRGPFAARGRELAARAGGRSLLVALAR